MPRPRRDRTYRVRQLQVPPGTDHRQLTHIIASLSDGLGPAENIQVYSLAASLPLSTILPTSVATIAFNKTPSVLDNDNTEWSLTARHLDWRRNVIFDTHFLGLTPLNDPEPRNHAFDCIAISGLASHPFGSWKSRGSCSNYMWLRDSLALDLPAVRTILYGYDSTLSGSESFQTVQDIAISFVAALAAARPAGLSTKPILFLAHSLGGIVLKHALLEMANSEARRYIFENVQAILFFGVPHKGMETMHLQEMVGNQPNGTLVTDLSPESTYLRILDDQFSGLALQSVRVISVFETKQSPTLRMSDTGHWQRDGPPLIAVSRDSATHRRSSPSDTLPVDRDHSGLVKFADGDGDYDRVLGYLQDLIPSLQQSASIMESSKYVSPTANVESSEAICSELLNSLRPQELDSRLSDIASPYESTFEWIWTAQDVGFISWLQKGNGTYWISGKPGSGKSTLMKYIYRSDRTEKELNSNPSDKILIRPGFFFHNRGSKYQKSLEGLLRSLLYQILSVENRILELVAYKYAQRSPERRLQWSRQDLEESWMAVRDQCHVGLSVCLFLDALDEYDGDPESMVHFLRSLVVLPPDSATSIKVCFSSRLYNVFIDEFKESSGFKIHERTQRDIEHVITERLSKSRSIREALASRDEQVWTLFRKIRNELASRAEGVFLWLRFALDDLLRSHREGDNMFNILDHLRSLPDELGNFYQKIIEGVPLAYRWETYVMLEAVLRSNEELTAEDLCGVLACSAIRSLRDTPQELPFPPSEDFAKSHFERRLRSRCGGLLELKAARVKKRYDPDDPFKDIFDTPPPPSQPRFTVGLMHQTVKEFVSQPGFRKIVLLNLRETPMENGHTFLAKYGLCSLYHASDELFKKDFSAVYNSRFLEHTTGVEMTTGKSQKSLLDDLPSTSFSLIPDNGRLVEFRTNIEPNSIMSFAVTRHLKLYVTEVFEMARNHVVNENPVHSLLHYAVATNPVGPTPYTGSISQVDMVPILLRAGANTKAVDGTFTPWGLMFSECSSSSISEIVSARARNFLELGEQDPNELTADRTRRKLHCNAIHITSRRFDVLLTRLLLQKGAAANPLDQSGETPLDGLVDNFVTPFDQTATTVTDPVASFEESYCHTRHDLNVERAYNTAMQLLTYGGRCTKKSLLHIRVRDKRDGFRWTSALSYFISCMEHAGYHTSLCEEKSRLEMEEEKEKRLTRPH